MGARGPAPTPTVLRVLRGNPSKRALPKHEAKPKHEIPKCPRWLDAAARKEWKWIAPRLATYRLLTEIDGAILADYCTAYARWSEAEQKAKPEVVTIQRRDKDGSPIPGDAFPIQNPWLAVSNKARDQMNRALNQLGMSPSARTSIITQPRTSDGERGTDPLGIL